MSNAHATVRRREQSIVVVSTCTTDWILDPAGGPAMPVPGGPGYYIPRALDMLDAPYTLLTGERIDVEARHTPNGEAYRLPPIAPIPLPAAIDADAVILSPIIREIDPFHLPQIHGLLIVDIQGLVRTPNVWTNETRGPFAAAPLLERADLIKASIDEVALLDDESKDALRRSQALITGGHHGAKIVGPQGELTIAVNRVDTENTIGAGDTFLASLTWALVRGASTEDAANEAARFTESVLIARARSSPGR
jgi:hypothetical protein